MSKYLLCIPCNLKHELKVSEVFIGKRFPLSVLGFKGFVAFPLIDNDDKYGFKLLSPQIQGLHKRDTCGNYSQTLLPNGTVQYHPRIARVYFVLNIERNIQEDNEIIRQIIEMLETITSKCIKCISLIHPSAVHWSYTKEEGYIDSIKTYVLLDTTTKIDHGIAGSISINFTVPKEEVTLKEFLYVYRNITKNISLQYELISDVYRCVKRNEYREVILNCATIIEKTFKEQIKAYLNKENTSDIIKEHILKTADGFGKILKVMNKFGIPSYFCAQIKKSTIDIRNKVIHGGYFPSKEEVDQAIKDAILIVNQYNVPIFID